MRMTNSTHYLNYLLLYISNSMINQFENIPSLVSIINAYMIIDKVSNENLFRQLVYQQGCKWGKRLLEEDSLLSEENRM